MSGIAEWLRLKDGKDYLLRTLTADDADRLFEFFHTHSEETIYRRYGYIFRNMSHQRAQELVSVDQTHDLALAVFEFVDGRDVIRAIGRYYLDREGESAEVAFVVAEAKRRIGICTAILRNMIHEASRRGLKTLWAVVLAENTGMLHLFRAFEAELKPCPEGNQVEVRLNLTTHPAIPDREARA